MKTNSAATKKQEPVSKLYAKALFEFAQERNELETAQKDLATYAEVMNTQPELRTALTAFMFSVDERAKLAEEVSKKLEVSPVVARFVQMLTQKGRIQLLPEIYETFRMLVDESKNVVRGTVTTVEPLNDAEAADLSKAFGRKFNKQVALDSVIDKSILGGLIVKIQGLTFDGSVKTTIRRLKENLERQSI